MRNVGFRQMSGGVSQRRLLLITEGYLQRAVAFVLDGPATVPTQSGYEGIEQSEAAEGQPEELRHPPLDPRREYPGGRVGRPFSDAARIDDLHGSAPRGELPGDRTASDSGTNDGDLHTEILLLWKLKGGQWKVSDIFEHAATASDDPPLATN